MAEYPSHFVRDCEGVCLKAASRNHEIGLGTRARRDFATVAESKIEIALALGVKGQPTYLFVDDHRSEMGRNGLSALIKQGTRRRGGCKTELADSLGMTMIRTRTRLKGQAE